MVFNMSGYLIIQGNAIEVIESKIRDRSVDCIFTSPNPPLKDPEVEWLVNSSLNVSAYSQIWVSSGVTWEITIMTI